jgi:hypothetical protein
LNDGGKGRNWVYPVDESMVIGRYTLPVSDDNIGSSGVDRDM